MTEITTDITFAVEATRKGRGTTTYTSYQLQPLDGAPEGHADIISALRVLSKQGRHSQVRHILSDMGLEDGEHVTLGEILAHEHNPDDSQYDDLRTPEYGIDAVERALRLVRYDPLELSVGDVVEVTRVGNDGPADPQRGVVRDVESESAMLGARAEITWGGRSSSVLENRDDWYAVRIGRASMMGQVHDIQVIDPADIDDDDLFGRRASVLEAAEIDAQAEGLSVEVEKTWETSTGEGDRATDLHARVTVSGDRLAEPVTVHCRNVFDYGWTASVEADLDDETERVVEAAARNNSPITTGVRL